VRSLLLVLFTICAACSSSLRMSSKEMDICEATFRYQWTPKTLDTLRTEQFFLGTGLMARSPWAKDFPAEFYARFADIGKPVWKRSDLNVSELRQASGSEKWLWFCEPPKRIAANTFQVRSGYWCGTLCMSNCRYALRERDGGWIVDESEDCIVF
jgi:hypothetical protein